MQDLIMIYFKKCIYREGSNWIFIYHDSMQIYPRNRVITHNHGDEVKCIALRSAYQITCNRKLSNHGIQIYMYFSFFLK